MKKTSIINQKLVEQRNISKESVLEIEKLYKNIDKLFNLAKKDKDLTYPGSGKKYINSLREIEFKLQELWKFDKDISKHSYWNKLEKCSCPKLDNVNSLYKNFDNNCVFHGNL